MQLKKTSRSSVVMAAAAAASAILVSRAFAGSIVSFNGSEYDQNFNSLPDPGPSDPVLGSSSIQAGNPFTYTPTGTAYNLPAPGNPNYIYGAYDFATPQSSSATMPGGLGLGATMSGWYAYGVNNNNFGASSGDKEVGGIISFGPDGTNGSDHTNRALGTIATKESGLTTFAVKLVNNSGTSLNQINFSYTGELWRQDQTQKFLNVGYNLGAANLTTSPTTVITSTAIPAAQLGFAPGNVGDLPIAGISAPVQTANISSGNVNLSSTWAPGQSLWLTFSISDASTQGQGIAIDDLKFNATNVSAATQPLWNTTTGTWDKTTGNWINGSPNPNLYKDGDAPIFGNIAADSVITVANGGVTPSNVTINNAAHTYTFTGASINGTGAVIKNGAGTAIFNSPNGYSGGTFINGGTLIVDGGDTRLGAAPSGATAAINIGGGTLKVQTTPLTTARQVNVFGPSTIDTNGLGVTISGASTVGDVLTKVGAGDLEFDNAVNFQSGNGGTLNIMQGNVILGYSAGHTVTQINSSTYNGNLIVKNGIRINFSSGTSNLTGMNGTSIYGGTGQIQIQSSLVGISNLSSTFGGIINLPIILNSLNLTGTGFSHLDVTQPVGTGGPSGMDPVNNPNGLGPVFTTTIGGTSNHTDVFVPPGIPTNLVFGRVISGYSDIQFGNGQTGGGSGNTTLLAQNTYTGTTIVNAGTSTIVIGVDNALPTGTDVIFGTNGGTKTPIIDLSGHNQQINSLSTGGGLAGVTSVTPGNYTITNSGPTNSVFTISGSTTPYTGWGGVISDSSPNNPVTPGTSGTLQLVKGGSSTLILSGPNSYQGGTIINGGTVQIDPALGGVALPTGTAVTNNANFIVNALATVAGPIDGTGTTTVTANGGLTATHIRQGALVVNANTVIAQTPSAGTSSATSVVSSLTIAGGSSLDLGNNGIVVNYAAASPLTTIANQIRNGGIISSVIMTGDTSHAIGFGEAADVVGASGGTFLGQPIAAGQTAVLARYTVIGDANLDGKVDFSDFVALSTHFGQADPSWAHGNFVGDPTIDFADFVALSTHFGAVALTSDQRAEIAAFAEAHSSAVPEPGLLSLAGLGALGLLARRRRRV